MILNPRKSAKKNLTKILLIDDENDFTELLAANLEEAGDFEVKQVNDPRQALPTAREFKPDICLVDLVMPKMDGGDVVNALQKDPNLKETPVVMLTALVEESADNPGEAQVRGGLPFISKTSDLSVILKTIADRVQKSAS
ncbi:response regulator [Roseibacillus ishigakijimensis]|uniref:Response regulator n=1 Tax=Roseibacillus ishigakijimensis TaxID=454146 RepID=A0A934RNA9_9BACT|nr:response regulator [Roseibacillus ishigakijimensis]MBK1832526.1 response regulator [Roseibacillus ishigakijimensis]